MRQARWKEWQRIRTRWSRLQALGMPAREAREWAMTNKGSWRAARTFLRRALPDACWAEQGPTGFANPYRRSGRASERRMRTRFKVACRAAGVREVRFRDLRHTFATRLVASGQPLRTIKEFLGHADSKTTQIYAHYAPSEHEVPGRQRRVCASPDGPTRVGVRINPSAGTTALQRVGASM
jgi:integrase